MSPLKVEPRSAWTDTPSGAFGNVRPSRVIDPSEVTGFVVHWPGDGGTNYAALSKAQVAAKLRAYYEYHTGTRNWADIGYPFAIDMAGRVWLGAGTDFAAAHSASPAYPQANHENMAALLIIGTDEAPSEEMLDSLQRLRDHLRETKFPNMTGFMGHREVRGASTACPGPHINAALFSGDTDERTSTLRVTSPIRGYVSSNYGYRTINGVRSLHAGLDIATGGNRRGVYAMFAGRVVRVISGRKHGQSASVGAVLAPGRSGNGVIVQNPDGERQLYGHVNPSVRVGQQVKVGQRIGTVDLSGITTGLHLHLEIWNSAGRTRNPMVDFRHFGITPGAAPSTVPTPSVPSPPPSSGGGGSATVRAYQNRQNRYAEAGLFVDGVNGNVTKNWRSWSEQAQRSLNAFRSSRKNLIQDGDYGAVTHNYVRDVQRRNGLYVDGILGPVMVRWMRSHGSNIRHRPPNRP